MRFVIYTCNSIAGVTIIIVTTIGMAICQVIHAGISLSHLYDYFLGFYCHDGDCGSTYLSFILWCMIVV